MKKNEIMEEFENDKTLIWKILSISVAIFLALGSVAYIVARVLNNQKHIEKWSDYDECGL